jgi:RNA polymerase sigma factor (sigma-70 family)
MIGDDTNFSLLANHARENYRLLTKLEEQDLAVIIQGDDESASAKAVEKLVLHNLLLVGIVANRYATNSRHHGVDDLSQEGILGLWRAAQKYEARNIRFSTYAIPWIEQAINVFTGKQDFDVSVTHSARKEARKAKENGPKNHHERQLVAILESSLSINNESDDGNTEWAAQLLVDTTQPALDHIIEREFTTEIHEQTLTSLSSVEYEVLTRRYGIECETEALNKIAETMGLEIIEIRRIEHHALRKLRELQTNNQKTH